MTMMTCTSRDICIPFSHGTIAVFDVYLGVFAGCQGCVDECPGSSAASAFMHFLSWLAANFAQAVKHSSRTSPTDTSHAHQQQQSSQQANVPFNAPVPLSADFYFFGTLLQPLLLHMQAVGASAGCANPALLTEAQQVAAPAASEKVVSNSKKQTRGNKQALKQAKVSPVVWHIAAEGTALLVQLPLGGVWQKEKKKKRKTSRR